MASKKFYFDFDFMRNQLLAARLENRPTAPTGPGEGQVFYHTVDKAFYGWNGAGWINISQVVAAATVMRGEISTASSNPAFPTSPTVGDTYFITSAGGTVGGLAVEVGDQLVRSTSGWFIVQANLQPATQALAGFMRFATQSEAQAGADLTTAVSPGTLATLLANNLYARKYRTLVGSLAANTATTITHGLALLNPEDCTVALKQGGQDIDMLVSYTSVNALTITSNQALGNVTVVVQG